MQKVAASVGRKFVGNAAGNYVVETQDPHYETYTNDRGKASQASTCHSLTGQTKRRRRAVPSGLNEHDTRILKKVRKRAHYLECVC